MNPEQIKNLKKLITLMIIPITMSLWVSVLCQVLKPNLLMVLFMLGMIMAIIRECTRILLED